MTLQRPSYTLPLADYPYILVRLRCRDCDRCGNYRLARLAAEWGSEITIFETLENLVSDCPRWEDGRILTGGFCEAYFPDLKTDCPPGLPPKRLPLRVLK